MQHALVEILDIGNTGISLTDYAPMHRIDGVDYWKPMPCKAHRPARRAQAGPCQGAGGESTILSAHFERTATMVRHGPRRARPMPFAACAR